MHLDLAQSETSLNLVKQRVSDGVTQAGGNPTALPWAQIIQFILSLLGSGGICPSPTPTPAKDPATAAAEAKNAAEKHPLASQMMLAAAYRKQGYPQPRQLAQGTISALHASSVEELTSVATTAQAMQSAAEVMID